jgi:hypothetical protein
VPPYRFNVMHAAASGAVDTLIQFGQSLLSLIERKEQAQLQELQQQQMWTFARFAIDLQEQAQQIDKAQRTALEASRKVIEGRQFYYKSRVSDGLSIGERLAGGLHLAGRIADDVGARANAVAAGLKLLPNAFGAGAGASGGAIFSGFGGASIGGSELDGVPEVLAALAFGVATQSHASAEAQDRTEQFRRREQEWGLAKAQADLEIEQIDAQLRVLDEQSKATDIQLQQAWAAYDQAQVMHTFLGKRFTHAQLYQWLNGQFATFYYQAYDAALAMCLAAEACWQFEIADFSTRFIQTGGWNDSQRGLGAGEALKLQLLRMEAAYLNRHERLLEITKTVSLRHLKAQDSLSTINLEWGALKDRLRNSGEVEFELTQPMFDTNHPNHTRRRIARVSVSLPVVLAPYADIRATLTQTYSAVQLGGTLKENLRASEQVALSNGVADDGLFSFDFRDERYVPFEGSGAISRWMLRFPGHERQLAMLETLTDIIVRVQYTAKTGAE